MVTVEEPEQHGNAVNQDLVGKSHVNSSVESSFGMCACVVEFVLHDLRDAPVDRVQLLGVEGGGL